MMHFTAGFHRVEVDAGSGVASSAPPFPLEVCVLVLDFLFNTHLEVTSVQREGSGAQRLEAMRDGYTYAREFAVLRCCETLQVATREQRGFTGAMGELLLQGDSLLRWLAKMEQLEPAEAAVLLEMACCMVGAGDEVEVPGPWEGVTEGPLEQGLADQVRGQPFWRIAQCVLVAWRRPLCSGVILREQGQCHLHMHRFHWCDLHMGMHRCHWCDCFST
jgi:hypothetical protein